MTTPLQDGSSLHNDLNSRVNHVAYQPLVAKLLPIELKKLKSASVSETVTVINSENVTLNNGTDHLFIFAKSISVTPKIIPKQLKSVIPIIKLHSPEEVKSVSIHFATQGIWIE